MSGDLEDDFPLNAGSDKLAKLFEENALPDISFKFSVPKHPSARPKPVQNNVPLKVQTGKTVDAFQLKVGGYKAEGKVGLAIIGNDEYSYYQLYMYRSDEKKVASVEIHFNFPFLIQDHNYASFKDSHDIQWSVHFDKPQDIVSFAKQVALARWRSLKGTQTKLVQEAFKGKTDTIAKKNDTLCVSYKISSLSPENTLDEEVRTKKVTAPANSSCWETTLIGACAKSKRFIIIPSILCGSTGISVPDGFHLLLEMEVEDVTPPQQPTQKPQQPTQKPQQPLQKPQQSSQSIANMELSSPCLTLNTSSQCSSDKKEEGERVFGRIAHIGYQLPSLQSSTENESNISISEQTKPVVSTKPVLASISDSSYPSAFSKEDSITSTEPCDITGTSQFNILFSEVRTSNSEIRMNINRVTDKVDSLISKMYYAPQMNHKVIPAIEKFQNIDGVLNKLVDQNNAIMQMLERNSPSRLESLVNEVMQLKKRNAELESVVEISKSTCQILKGKVIELNEKLSEMKMEKNSVENVICSSCHGGGDKKIKSLEATVKNLQERNYSLIQATEHLECKNRNLSKQLAPNNELILLQTKLAEKNTKIVQLEKELDSYTSSKKLDISNENTKDKGKKSVNKLLKRESNDFVENVEMDDTLRRLLEDTVKGYVQDKNNSNNRRMSFQDNKGNGSGEKTQEESVEECDKAKALYSPFSTPLPVPRPRRPITSEAANLSVGSNAHKIIESKASLKLSESESSSPDDNSLSSNENLTLGGTQQTSNKKDMILLKRNLIDYNHAEELGESDKGVENLSTETPDISKNDIEVLGDSEYVSSPIKQKDEQLSDFYDPYSSSHYTPFLRTTPPPITDD